MEKEKDHKELLKKVRDLENIEDQKKRNRQTSLLEQVNHNYNAKKIRLKAEDIYKKID
jgi:hypothetical protein